ncbi:MAG: oxidoreductase, partial [Prevotellaceae bacterium]|nr:oxidoreductase [Prevotellaceae bacterium]
MLKSTFYTISALIVMLYVNSCNTQQKSPPVGAESKVRLITLDPGHFHAALVQKNMYPQVDSTVFVYAPEGDDLNEHLERIKSYNHREDSPASWKETVYRGDDFLEKMIAEKKGNVMITAGNNRNKTKYIKRAVDAGINVLADKPMAINRHDFELLRDAFSAAQENGVLLYDIMTERFEITTILQKELSLLSDVFGFLEFGLPDKPSVVKESVHHFAKYVSGTALKRPAWFFDVEQQGEGIVDVTTHLVDLVQWECFP